MRRKKKERSIHRLKNSDSRSGSTVKPLCRGNVVSLSYVVVIFSKANFGRVKKIVEFWNTYFVKKEWAFAQKVVADRTPIQPNSTEPPNTSCRTVPNTEQFGENMFGRTVWSYTIKSGSKFQIQNRKTFLIKVEEEDLYFRCWNSDLPKIPYLCPKSRFGVRLSEHSDTVHARLLRALE